MYSNYASDKAAKTVRRLGTRDPFEIARETGAFVYFRDDFINLKGMYAIVKRRRCVFINGNLPKRLMRIVCAHELGHDTLHRELAESSALQEFALYDMKSRPEYDANIFAAHLLIDGGEVLRLAGEGYDVFQIAAELDTDINLLLIRINELNRQGHGMNLPYIPRGDFLGNTLS